MPKLLITIREPDGNLLKFERDRLSPWTEHRLRASNMVPPTVTAENYEEQAQVITFDTRELVKVEAVL